MFSFRHLLKHAPEHISLAEFAANYQPAVSTTQNEMVWDYLIDVVLTAHTEHRDKLLSGLYRVLRDTIDQDYAYICLSAGCEVGVHISSGEFCLEPEDSDPLCCSRSYMLEALNGLISAHRSQAG